MEKNLINIFFSVLFLIFLHEGGVTNSEAIANLPEVTNTPLNSKSLEYSSKIKDNAIYRHKQFIELAKNDEFSSIDNFKNNAITTAASKVNKNIPIFTIEQCLDIVTKNNPNLKAALSLQSAAKAKALIAKRKRLPAFSTILNYTHLSEVDPFTVDTPIGQLTLFKPILDTYLASLQVQQPIFTGFRLKNESKLNLIAEKLSETAVKKERRELRYQTFVTYYQLLRSKNIVRILKETLITMKNHLQDVINLKAAGMTTKNDVLQSKVLLSQTKIKLNQAEALVKINHVKLQSIIFLPDEQSFTIAENSAFQVNKRRILKKLIETAYENRIEIKSAILRKKISKTGTDIAKGAYFPLLLSSAAITYARPHPRYQPPVDKFDTDWQIGVAMQYTPFNWGITKQSVIEAKAKEQASNYELLQLKVLIHRQVSASYEGWLEAKNRLSLVKIAEKQAIESLRVAKEQYQSGISKNSDVLDAETALLRAKLDIQNSRLDYILANAALNQAIGVSLLPDNQKNK